MSNAQEIARSTLTQAVRRISHFANVGACVCEKPELHGNAVAEIAVVLEAMSTAILALDCAPQVLATVSKTLTELRDEEKRSIEDVVRKARAIADDTPEELRAV
jgi:hypothetical protein